MFLCLAAPAWAGEPEQTIFETYSVAFCDPHAAAETVRALAGEGGSVVLDQEGQRLLVVTTRERHRQIAGMMERLNAPPRNVQIDVRFRGRSETRETGASLVVGEQRGREEGISHTTLRFKPRVKDTTTRASADVTQTLLVASGREALLRVGESVPYLEWLVDYGLQCGYIRGQVTWQDVGSYLVVEPTVIGEGPMIRIRITPELSGLVGGNPYRVRYARAATEIVALDGQAFQLAASDQNREFYSRFLIGMDRTGGWETLDISLTARIVSAPVP